MSNIEKLKEEYNKLVKRNKNCEEYFNTHEPQYCEKYQYLFNEITIELGKKRTEIEKILKRQMTTDEIFNGLK